MIRSLLVVLAILVLFAGVLFFAQDGMIYLPRRYDAREIEGWKRRGFVELEFSTSQGRQGAFYQAPVNGSEPALIWLVFGGNGGRSMDYRDVARNPDWGYLFVDYPGYGLCEGKPNPKRIDDTVDGAIQALWQKLGVDGDVYGARLCVLGHSLGAAVALRAAVRYEIDQSVLLAPFTTMGDMAASVVGGLYANVLRHRFDNVASMEELRAVNPDARVAILNGTDDREIPPEMGRALAEQFSEMTDYSSLDGVGHNDILDADMPAVLQAMGSPLL
ncbi:MAG: alpha/beta fold hydrolase [Verrucomicrobiales bacterium]